MLQNLLGVQTMGDCKSFSRSLVSQFLLIPEWPSWQSKRGSRPGNHIPGWAMTGALNVTYKLRLHSYRLHPLPMVSWCGWTLSCIVINACTQIDKGERP